MSRNELQTDAIIVGGGPAGVATALQLARGGMNTLIIERSGYRELRVGETLPPTIQHPLALLGLWESFAAAGHRQSFGIRSIWGSGEPYDESFISNPYGPGWHVDRLAFDRSLAAWAEQQGVRVMRNARLLACDHESRAGWRLGISSDSGTETMEATAGYIVDATGRASALARYVGARRTVYDHLVGLYGFPADGTATDEADGIALIEATENGWWYSAPLPGRGLVAAFMTDADLCARAELHDAAQWNNALQETSYTKERLAGFSSVETVRVIAANSSLLEPVCGADWFAVGEAAFAYDPLTGSGVHRALLSGIRAAEAILASRSGKPAASACYGEEVREAFSVYLQGRTYYYSREPRWPASPFWTRRRNTAH